MDEKYKHYQLSQKILLYRPGDKKFLLVKDGDPKSEYYRKFGPWELPGGRVDAREDPIDAFNREIEEELGEDIQFENKGIVSGALMTYTETSLDDPHRAKMIYLAIYQSGEIKISNEHSEFEWKTVKEIEEGEEYKPWLKEAVRSASVLIQNEEYLNDLKRVQADFENYKKRQQAEAKEFSTHLAKSLVSDLIPVLTNLQAAAEHVPEDLKTSPWVMGITYIEKQFEDALKNYDVVPIEVKPGDTFNPMEHEAVDQKTEDGKESEHKIEKVVQKGYKMGERVIKAARVIVS